MHLFTFINNNDNIKKEVINMEDKNNMKRLLLIKEVLVYLGLKDRRTFKKFENEYNLPHIVIGGQKKYDIEDINKIISEKKTLKEVC